MLLISLALRAGDFVRLGPVSITITSDGQVFETQECRKTKEGKSR